MGQKTVGSAVALGISALSMAVAGELPWWAALLAVCASGIAIGARAALANLPGEIAGQLQGALAGAVTPEALGAAAAQLDADGRAKVRAVLDAADAAEKKS